MFAFDRSMRRYDADGRLHVETTRISKATVNPYYGREIPRADELGLQADRVYYLLRDPDELAAAASTFNNLPVLARHVPVSATGEDTHAPDLVVGSTGTDAAFHAPYLTNSAVIWAGPAIAGVESREQQEWSCAYRYVADMTPGTYKGLHYDGIMRNIVGNHVALVEAGRAGSDVVVGDTQLEGKMTLNSRTAILLQGALTALVAPRLAAGMAFDAAPLVAAVNRRNYAKATRDIPARLLRQITPKLAADEGLDVDDVIKVIGAVQGGVPDDMPDAIPDEPPAVDDDCDIVSKILAFCKGKLSDEDLAELSAMGGMTGDEFPPKDDDKKDEDDKPAMDSKAVLAEVAAIRTAEKAVFPLVGEVIGMDSAAAVYRVALDAAKVDLKGVHPSAYGPMVALLNVRADSTDRKPVAVAMDAKAADDFAKRFPTAGTLKRA